MASKSNRNIPTISVPESKSASILGSSGLVKRVVPQAKSCGSSPHFVGMTSTLSQDAVNLNWVREEAEWEKCSVNPGVARQVKTRNIIERRRLAALQTQLDRKLEKELKRLTIERREFSDVLDNLLIRRRKSHQLNVRRHRRRDSHEAEVKSQPLSLNLIYNENQRFQRDVVKSSYSVGSTPFTPPMSTRADIGRASFHGGSSGSIMSSPEMRPPKIHLPDTRTLKICTPSTVQRVPARPLSMNLIGSVDGFAVNPKCPVKPAIVSLVWVHSQFSNNDDGLIFKRKLLVLSL
ncbi:hypothetical protein EG68_05880 [Paragonimus skrjabini miyazakii]|uniref:Uncharacterized protein n=1 Tax=Paragonimus skrjabini miyazakii TaxID=59628 RepID=A0A8S9YQK9_9TREM|nr:hypothetical protein EG68_05880 [Paragonimus skrjabini miyazakii]